MALPGTPGQRISDLCNGNKIKQKELAEKIGVSASQLSRIVSGETRTVRGSSQRACDGCCGCANPKSLAGTQELPETDRFDTDLFSGHSGKGHYGTKPAY